MSSFQAEAEQQDDQETTPKRAARRGRPSKAAATEDSGEWNKIHDLNHVSSSEQTAGVHPEYEGHNFQRFF